MHFVFVIQTRQVMPKVKRGRRHHHAQPKNGESKHQNRRRELQVITNKVIAPSESTREQVDCSGQTFYDASSEQSPDVVQTTAEVSTASITHCGERDQPNSEFETLKTEFSQSDVHNWHIFMNADLIQLSYNISNTPPEPSTVSKVLNVYKNMEWKVFIYGNLIPLNSGIISDFPSVIQSYSDAKQLLEFLTESSICKGNNENDFIEQLLQSRGGEIKNHLTVTAYLDKVTIPFAIETALLSAKEEVSVRSAKSTGILSVPLNRNQQVEANVRAIQVVMLITDICKILNSNKDSRMCSSQGGPYNEEQIE